MSKLKKQGLSALFWDLLGKLSTQGISFFITIVLARLLEPSDFGLIAIVMVVVGLAQVFTDIGLGGALIQKEKVDQTHYSSVFFFNLSIATLMFIVTQFSAKYIANFYDLEKLEQLIKVAGFLFIFNSFSSIQIVRLRKQLNYSLITKAGLIAAILSGIVGVLLALCEFGVWSLLYQVLCQSIFNSLVLWLISKWRPTFIFSLESLVELWSFGFRMFLSGFLDAIYSRLDYLIVGKLFSQDTLGYFQRAKQFNMLIIQYTSGSLMSVLFPVLSQIQNDLPRFQTITLNALHVLSFVTFLLVGGLYLLSEEVIVFLFSEKWLQSAYYMELLMLSAFGYPLSALLVNVLSSRGNSKAFLKLEVLKKAIHTVNFVNAGYFGIESYLYGLVITTLIGVSLNVVFAANEVKLRPKDFYTPIAIQIGLCLISVYCTLVALKFFSLNYLLSFFFKGIAFVTLFVGLNFVLNTQSYKLICIQLTPLFNKIRNSKC